MPGVLVLEVLKVKVLCAVLKVRCAVLKALCAVLKVLCAVLKVLCAVLKVLKVSGAGVRVWGPGGGGAPGVDNGPGRRVN